MTLALRFGIPGGIFDGSVAGMSVPTPEQVAAMTPGQWKVYENLCRRIAARQLFTLHKTRRRDKRAHDYGVFWLTNHDGTTVVSGQLWEIHHWLINR